MTDTASQETLVERLNEHCPPFVKLMGGHVIAANPIDGSCTFEFCVPTDYCHSGDVVQGGFVAAMLDAAMAHAVFASETTVTRLSSLEISTRFESVTRGNAQLRVEGRIKKMTRSIAFLEADIRGQDGEVLACASSTAKVARDAT